MPGHFFYTPLTYFADTVKPLIKKDAINANKVAGTDTAKLPAADTTKLPGMDSVIKQKIDTFSLKVSKDSLEAPLKYEAAD
ncbi:MAG: hypothetical protein WAQ93_03555, partial [Chitinophagaceae bacterium]